MAVCLCARVAALLWLVPWYWRPFPPGTTGVAVAWLSVGKGCYRVTRPEACSVPLERGRAPRRTPLGRARDPPAPSAPCPG